MKGFKGILQSRTFWGALLAIVSAALGLAGYTFGAEDQQALIEVGTAIGTALGGLIAIFGRISATKKIG